MTAHEYMWHAVEDIEKKFGKGAALKHIAAYMQTASIDMAGAIIAQQIRAGLDTLADNLAGAAERIAAALESSPQERVAQSLRNYYAKTAETHQRRQARDGDQTSE
jgi:hypothetical protein